MWVCPTAPVLESAWVSLGVHACGCLCGHISVPACHICFPSLMEDNSPLHPFPFPGPEPALRGRLLSHWLSFCDLHPCKRWLSPLALSSLPPAPGLSFTPDRGGPQAQKGHQRHVARGGKQGGAHYTGPFLPLYPNHTSFNSPDHLGTLKYTPPYTHTPSPPSSVFAIRSVATREPCSIGEAGGMGGEASLSRGLCKPTPTPLIQPSAAAGAFAKATQPRPRPRPLPRRLGVGAGAGGAGLRRTVNKPRRAGELRRPAAGPGPGVRSRRAGQRPGGPSRGRPGRHLCRRTPGPTDLPATPPFPRVISSPLLLAQFLPPQS
ncbi:translation initiation factor IF-2-like isoform X2 [Vulpes lagopus]|uniref:translation initiation factor IF-2-like isoform X2 n=1 Tax=Vulpes lagopus TaxID=494514 RepID=UPI001BC9DFDF|nr:translation initiation factor IF-2-like isoform X2 [Vulpes lagopus]